MVPPLDGHLRACGPPLTAISGPDLGKLLVPRGFLMCLFNKDASLRLLVWFPPLTALSGLDLGRLLVLRGFLMCLFNEDASWRLLVCSPPLDGFLRA